MTENQSPQAIPYLSLTISNFNPNHKYRFLLFTPPDMRWLADLSFATGDESVYLAPQLEREYTVVGRDAAGVDFAITVSPTEDLHVSFHHSGRVNLTAGARRVVVRGMTNDGLFGRIFALGIRERAGLKKANDQEINGLPTRYSVLPVTGFLDRSPVYLTVFRIPASSQWDIPHLSDTFQMNFECLIRDKDVKYEFLVWQNAKLPTFAGDVAISL